MYKKDFTRLRCACLLFVFFLSSSSEFFGLLSSYLLSHLAIDFVEASDSPSGNILTGKLGSGRLSHTVALQVAFERQILKPVFHLIGYRLWV